MSHLDPDSAGESATDESFLERHSLLCRWQKQLEFFLYHILRSAAPAIADECHWSCPEAAELSRLSEKAIEYFCFHHKKLFQSCGITENERESFCSDLHRIRQIRHCAVHRVPVNATTIAKYARSAQSVLAILNRLGGTEFREGFGGLLDQFIQTFWDVRSPSLPQVTPHRATFQQQGEGNVQTHALSEGKAMNIRRMRDLQNSAMERKLANITRMANDIEISHTQKAARWAKSCQQTEESQQRKIEREQRHQQERDEADRQKSERAQRSQQERDEADRKKAERAQRSQQERDEADRKKAERAQRSQQERDESVKKNMLA